MGRIGRAFAVAYVRNKTKEVYHNVIKDQQRYFQQIEQSGVPLWEALPPQLRQQALVAARPFHDTIMELNPDEIASIIREELERLGVAVGHEWLKNSLLQFRKDLNGR